jgi:hypothetical protein
MPFRAEGKGKLKLKVKREKGKERISAWTSNFLEWFLLSIPPFSFPFLFLFLFLYISKLFKLQHIRL